MKHAGYGAVVLVRNGSTTTRLAAGLGRLSPRTPIRPTDRFRVGSITKTFVATVLLQLEAEGALGLDDPLEQWLPGLVPNGDAISIRQLLNHSSGIYSYTDDAGFSRDATRDPQRAWSPRRIVAVATRHKPLFAPGEGWSYSNTNYILAGLVVRAVTGRGVADELRTRIFEPLGLGGTSFPAGSVISGPHAHGYSWAAGKHRDVTSFNPSWAWTAGAIVSTADDLATFYGALLGGRLLAADGLKQLERTVSIESSTTRYGLGILRTRISCGIVWGHNGQVTGYVANVYSSPDGRRSAVVLINTDDLDNDERGAYQKVFDLAFCG